MLEMPDASPTWSAATHAVEPDDAGPLAMPRPTASTMSGPTNAPYAHEASTNARTASPAAPTANPSATRRSSRPGWPGITPFG
jgi:hypothetical protein